MFNRKHSYIRNPHKPLESTAFVPTPICILDLLSLSPIWIHQHTSTKDNLDFYIIAQCFDASIIPSISASDSLTLIESTLNTFFFMRARDSLRRDTVYLHSILLRFFFIQNFPLWLEVLLCRQIPWEAMAFRLKVEKEWKGKKSYFQQALLLLFATKRTSIKKPLFFGSLLLSFVLSFKRRMVTSWYFITNYFSLLSRSNFSNPLGSTDCS